MEVYKDVPKNFLSKFERMEPVVLDNTAISLYKLCGRKYFFRMVLGYDKPEIAPYFVNGGSYHKYREHFELNWKSNFDLSFDDRFDLSHFMAQDEAVKLWNKRTGNKEEIPSAAHTKWDWMTRSRLIKTLDFTSLWLKNEKKLNNIIVVATEQPFIVEIIKGLFYGGKADQVVRWNNRLWGRDFKSSSQRKEYFKRTLKPNSQFIGYTVAEELLHGNTVDGQLVEVVYNTKTEGPTITPFPNSFNVFEKGIWKRDLSIWNERITTSRLKDEYPVNENHCSFCQFHQVCQSTSEASMEATLESKYVNRPWDFMNSDDNELEAA